MALYSDQDIIQALRRAAEALVGRPISGEELNTLIQHFNQTSGTEYQRAIGTLSKFAGISEARIVEKTAASDNTDRLIQDLQATISQWTKDKK